MSERLAASAIRLDCPVDPGFSGCQNHLQEVQNAYSEGHGRGSLRPVAALPAGVPMTATTHSPVELRIRWMPDDEPYDPGDTDHCDDHAAFTDGCETCETYRREVWEYVETWGVFGCVVETRAPACGCCGLTDWQHAASLWSIVGDDAYHREIERDLMSEVTR